MHLELLLGQGDVLACCMPFLQCSDVARLRRCCRKLSERACALDSQHWLDFAHYANAVYVMRAMRRAICAHEHGHACALFCALHERCVLMTGSDAFFLGLVCHPLDEPHSLLTSAMRARNYAWVVVLSDMLSQMHTDIGSVPDFLALAHAPCC
jgi:hypothetical protein